MEVSMSTSGRATIHLVRKPAKSARPAILEKTYATPVNLEQLLDSEILTALRRAVDGASPERCLLLLTIAEHPELDNRVEQIIAAVAAVEELR